MGWLGAPGHLAREASEREAAACRLGGQPGILVGRAPKDSQEFNNGPSVGCLSLSECVYERDVGIDPEGGPCACRLRASPLFVWVGEGVCVGRLLSCPDLRSRLDLGDLLISELGGVGRVSPSRWATASTGCR